MKTTVDTKIQHVLIIDDSHIDAAHIHDLLSTCHIQLDIQSVSNRAELVKAIKSHDWDLVICDYHLPGFMFPDVMNLLQKHKISASVIVISGAISESIIAEIMRLGARDFLLKDNLTRLLPVVEREITDRNLRLKAEDELKLKEKQVQIAQRMESTARLAGGIAHDFNNFLAVISACSECLYSELDPHDRRREEVTVIMDVIKKASEITRQLLSISRHQDIKLTTADLNQLLSNFRPMLDAMLGDDIRLSLDLDPKISLVTIDVAQLEQVILNLISNARDAIKNNGNITITTQMVEISDSFSQTYQSIHAGPHVALIITDNGHGMDEATQARIFEPFFTTKEMGKGTGLGLSTAYGILKQFGGSIWVESKLEKGSTFKIFLPVCGEQSVATIDTATQTHKQNILKILLVEDQEMVLKFTAKILEKHGFHVFTASNVDAALEIATNEHSNIDLLLTDVVMPKMSGLELAQQVQMLCTDVRVLFMSGYSSEILLKRGLLIPQLPLLSKPFTSDLLLKKIQEQIGDKN